MNEDRDLRRELNPSAEWTIEVWKSKALFRQKWRFRIRAANGEIICPPEPMTNKKDTLDIAKKLAPFAKVEFL